MDSFEAVRRAGVEAVNYDLSNAAIIRQLEDWNRRLGLEVLEVAGDRVVVRFTRLPSDLEAFIDEELMEFCPDTLFQNYDGPEELLADLKATRTLTLWWD